MVDPDDDPLEDVLARARDRAARYAVWLDHLRSGDPAFAEASALYPADMSEWQSAVYLLTGNDGVWGEFGAAVMRERSIGPVIHELESPSRPWASSQDAVMRWAAHFWDVDRWPAKFPYVFEQFLFYRWVTACHLRQRIPPALTVTHKDPGPVIDRTVIVDYRWVPEALGLVRAGRRNIRADPGLAWRRLDELERLLEDVMARLEEHGVERRS